MTIETTSIQDYLKTIFDLTRDAETASTTALAARLRIAPASVTGMIQKLAAAKPPLVHYRKHQGVTLTADGERSALEVIRHHRLIETYLVQMLGYRWDTVHEEACRLEHVISEEFEAKIAAALGNPKRDPHGELIPDADLRLPADTSTSLSALRAGQSAIILRVRSDEPAFLRHMAEIGLLPGTNLSIKSYSSFDQNLELQIGDQPSRVIGLATSSRIFVEIQTL
ncbi:MAG: DtxR family transcriptional regulator [Chloroflexi bacterium HGW-Chloroflexi-6]|nr:MAG: DtxR family transcriptional regulator [Chloroflexi bacterium HGW-Chloroflexi-6]